MSRYHTCSHDLVCIFVWSICNFYSHELTWFSHGNSHIIAKIASFNQKHASKRERWFWIFLYESNMRFKINSIGIHNTVGDAVFAMWLFDKIHIWIKWIYLLNMLTTVITTTTTASSFAMHSTPCFNWFYTEEEIEKSDEDIRNRFPMMKCHDGMPLSIGVKPNASKCNYLKCT